MPRCARCSTTPDLKKRALELGIEAKASYAGGNSRQRLNDDIAKWAKVIERAGIEKQ